jgi:site-specific DNA recombinase
MRCVIYCRVSTHDQKDNTSLPEQERMCLERAQERGYAVIEIVKEDISGAKVDRPGMNQVLDLAADSAFDILLIADLDRFARSPEAKILIKRELENYGVKIEYVLKDFSDDPSGRLMEDIFTAIASHERELIRMRSMRGKRAGARMGISMAGGPTKYGYGCDPERGADRVYIDDCEAEVVKYIYDLYTKEKIGIPSITQRLNDEGYKPRQARQWATSVVYGILIDPYYMGLSYFGKTKQVNGKTTPNDPADWIGVSVPAIIDEKTYLAAQRQRKDNNRQNPRNQKKYYMLSGRITCDVCGSLMSGTHSSNRYTKKDGTERYYFSRRYRCYKDSTSHKAAGGEPCKSYISADVVEDIVWGYIFSLISDPQAMADAFLDHQQKRESETEKLKSRRGILEQEINKLTAAREKLLDLMINSDNLTKEAIQTRLKNIDDQQRSLEAECRRLSESIRQEVPSIDFESLRTLCEFMIEAGIDDAGKKEIVQVLDLEVRVNASERSITVQGGVPDHSCIYSTTRRHLEMNTRIFYQVFCY